MAEPGTHSWDNTLVKVSMHLNMLGWSKNISHNLNLKTSCVCCEFCIELGIREHDFLPAFHGWLVTLVRNHLSQIFIQLRCFSGHLLCAGLCQVPWSQSRHVFYPWQFDFLSWQKTCIKYSWTLNRVVYSVRATDVHLMKSEWTRKW